MDTVFCVTITYEDLNGGYNEERIFICKNLYTAQIILKREYEQEKHAFLEEYEEDTCFDTDDFSSKDFVLYAEDIFNCTWDIAEKQIFNLYKPLIRSSKKRLKDLIQKKWIFTMLW